MSRSSLKPTLRRARAQPRGRPVDRLIAGLAAAGLFASIATTLWFFAGFAETDPGFAPASSAFLLSCLLGAFAIIPCAVVAKMAWRAWRLGFRRANGLWALLLMGPWVCFAGIAMRSDWMPIWLSIGPLLIAVPTILWAMTSLILDHRRPDSR